MILLEIGFVIASKGQTASSNVCMSAREFDFYAEALVRYEFLKKDTALLRSQIKSYQHLIFEKDLQLKADSLIISNKNGIIEEYSNKYQELGIKYEKEVRKNRRFRLLSSGLGTMIVGMGALILFLK